MKKLKEQVRTLETAIWEIYQSKTMEKDFLEIDLASLSLRVLPLSE